MDAVPLHAFHSARLTRAQPSLVSGDRRDELGPFDIIGDVHGCFEELDRLLSQLGYHHRRDDSGWMVTHPAGRRLVFHGDLVNHGPSSSAVIGLVMDAVADGTAFCLRGSHDAALLAALQGNADTPAGVRGILDELEGHGPAHRKRVAAFLAGLPRELVLDEGQLLVGRAALPSPRAPDAVVVMASPAVRSASWDGTILYLNTRCVDGGSLSALRYPELEVVSVDADLRWRQAG